MDCIGISVLRNNNYKIHVFRNISPRDISCSITEAVDSRFDTLLFPEVDKVKFIL